MFAFDWVIITGGQKPFTQNDVPQKLVFVAVAQHPKRRKNMNKTSPFILLDVGCHGGLHPVASAFSGHMEAHGFDLEAGEIARLNAASDKPTGAFYHHIKLVGVEESNPAAPERLCAELARGEQSEWRKHNFNSDFFSRSSAFKAAQILGLYERQEVARENHGANVPPVEMTLDVFAAENKLSHVDFIKTDTDGFDIHVLRGATGLLQHGVLGLLVECSLNGVQSENANLFRHVYALLQGYGFSLFDMKLQRYARAAMPLPFVNADPAQTVEGQVNWCDALYFRDCGAPDYEDKTGFSPSVAQIKKLLRLYQYFGFPDCAAELLLKYRAQLSGTLALDALLQSLTPTSMGALSYEEYMATFEHLVGLKKVYPFGRIKIR